MRIGARVMVNHNYKNDIIRLVSILSGNEKVNLPSSVAKDMKEFIEQMEKEQMDLRSLGIRQLNREQILAVLRKVYFD